MFGGFRFNISPMSVIFKDHDQDTLRIASNCLSVAMSCLFV
jgi:hypothetical protein